MGSEQMKEHLFKKLIPLEEAKEIAFSKVKPIEEKEQVDLLALSNRVLAEDIKANFDVPPFDKAAMDGYAVKAEDTYRASIEKPIKLRCIGIIYAGEISGKVVKQGTCIKISTGAKLPLYANAMVRLEDIQVSDEVVQIFRPVYPYQDIIRKGADISKGSLLLQKEDLLIPPKIGSLASQGIRKVIVYRKPKISIIPTGNEIQKLDKELAEGQVYDINSYTLATLIKDCGGIPKIFPIILDKFDKLKGVIREALSEADVVLISGGSSVGTRDLIPEVISELGRIFFHGVQIRPGMPTLFGAIKNKLIFGIPGYPTSCMITSYLFVSPVVRKLAHLPYKPKVVKARLASRHTSPLSRCQLLPVKLDKGLAYPVFKGSGAITSTANAKGWIEIPINVEFIEKGEEVEVKLWG
jgi:molybdenum cofactor synthesis domain-containing protein